jgi:hypothetical protein
VVCPTECDREASRIRRPWHTSGLGPWGGKDMRARTVAEGVREQGAEEDVWV